MKPALLLLLLAVCVPTHAQTPAAPGSLTGRVVVMNGEASSPIRRARVTATSPSGVFIADTDTDGRYRLDGLAAGAYSIDVVKPGFYVAANAPNGVAHAGTTAQVAAGTSAVKDVVVERGASIEGVVLDRDDNPVADAVVQARAFGRERESLNAVMQAVRSDDHGRYRVHSLPPGQYLVEVGSLDRLSTPAAPRAAGMPTYHPGALSVPNAKSVTVPPQETVKGIDITLLSPVFRQRAPAGAPPAGAPPAGTGARIGGRITNADDTAPIAGATVTLSPSTPPFNVRRIITDAQGRYDAAVRAATYRVSASADGFAARTIDTRVELPEGRSFDRADVALSKLAAVEGRVLDEFGDPAPGVSVWLATPRFFGGARMANAGFQIFPRPTDDRGMFRIFDVAPGDYYVTAMSGPFSRGLDVSGFALSYYPGTRNETGAALVRVDSGRDRSGVDFAVVAAPLSEVRGVVVTPDNAPVAQASVALLPMTGGDVRNLFARAYVRTAADGSFVFRNIPEGRYAIQAQSGAGATSPLFGYSTVDATVPSTSGTRVEVRGPARVRGRGVFEGDGPRPTVRVYGSPADYASSPFEIRARIDHWAEDNTFIVDGYVGRLMILATVSPDSWVLTRVTRAGTDVTDTAIDFSRGDVGDLELTFKRIGASLTGSVTDGQQPVANYSVVVFPAEPEKRVWPARFTRVAEINQEGVYRVSGLPPGEYMAIALPALPPGDPQWNAEWLSTIAGNATRLSLRDGEALVLPLKLVK